MGTKHARGDVRRDAIAAFVAEHWRVKGWAPSLAEVGQAVGLAAVSAVHKHVAVLVACGVLAMDRGKPRSLRVVVAPTGVGATTARSNEEGLSVGAAEGG